MAGFDSKHTNDEIAARMIGTADDIKSANPDFFADQLGSGRINAFRALTDDPKPLLRVIDWKISGPIRPGETVEVKATIQNRGGNASHVRAVVATDNPYA